MGRYFVIADDLTGANAMGALLRKEGLVSWVSVGNNEMLSWENSQCDTLILPVESRNVSPQKAYELVWEKIKHIKGKNPPPFITKRIDSTLRGNVGSEIDAVLNFLEDEYVLAVVPAFPDAGRIVLSGSLFVNGILLEHTEAALDPQKPVCCSNVVQIIEAQSRYQVGRIDIVDVRRGRTAVFSALAHLRSEGCRIIVFDGETNGDLKIIADTLVSGRVRFASADSGPFTAKVVKAQVCAEILSHKVFLLVGSVNPVTREQVRAFCHTYGKECVILVHTRLLISGPDERKAEIKRAVNRCLGIFENRRMVMVAGDGIYPENKLDFSEPQLMKRGGAEQLSNLINDGLSEIATAILRGERKIRKLYASGGDIALSLLKQTAAKRFVPLKEVTPLAVYGIVMGGEMDGYAMITKGGMAGTANTIVKCASYLNKCR